MQRRSTLDDIARRAGVSASTVSRVLNGSKRVAEEKRALVLAAVEEYGYRPNPAARGLVRGRSMTVGVVIQDISNPFFASMVAGIEQALDQSDYRPMFASTHWRAEGAGEEAKSLQLLLERRVDGVIVLASSIADEELLAAAAQLPLVVVARSVPGLAAHCLTFDNEEGGYRATRYLLGLGHTRIAHLAGPPGHPDGSARLEGYRRALGEAGVEERPGLVVAAGFTEQGGLGALGQLLARGEPFSAIFAANDLSAYGAMLGLFNHGYRIPADLSLVGFDDQFLSAYTLPPLTTVRQPSVAMGRAAAEGLLRLLAGEPPALPRFGAELIVRKSAQFARPG